MNGDQIRSCQRLAGQVKRYHTWPTLNTQSVAEHTWQVMRIYWQIFGLPSQDIYGHILYHDAGELGCGDIPYPVKAKNPEIKGAMDRLETDTIKHMGAPQISLRDSEMLRVKIAHMIEMWEFGIQEVCMGNRLAQPIVSRTFEALLEMLTKLEDYERIIVRGKVMAHIEEFQRCMT